MKKNIWKEAGVLLSIAILVLTSIVIVPMTTAESSDTLLTEDFDPISVFPPDDWTRTNTKWIGSATNCCGGGDFAEARFIYYPSETGQFRLYTSSIDTRENGEVEIEFKP